MKNNRLKIGIALGFVATIIVVLWSMFEETYTYRNFLFWWEETFRPNWSELTRGLSRDEAYVEFILPYRSLRGFPLFPTYLFILIFLKYWIRNDNKQYSISKDVSFLEYINRFNFKTLNFSDFVFVFSIYYIFREVIKAIIGFGFPYIYGPLFLVIAIGYVVFYTLHQKKIYNRLVAQN